MFDAALVEMGIAVGAEQAITGGEQGSRAIAFDTAALQDQPRYGNRRGTKGAKSCQVAGDLVVEVGCKLQAPGVV